MTFALEEMELASLPKEREHAGLEGIAPESEWQELLLSHLAVQGEV